MGTDTLTKFVAAPMVGILFIMGFMFLHTDIASNYAPEEETVENSTLADMRGHNERFLNFTDELQDETEDSVGAQRDARQDIFGSIFGNIVSGVRMVFDSIDLFTRMLVDAIPALQLGPYGRFVVSVATGLVALTMIGVFLKWILKT